jgi:hypothetical protein
MTSGIWNAVYDEGCVGNARPNSVVTSVNRGAACAERARDTVRIGAVRIGNVTKRPIRRESASSDERKDLMDVSGQEGRELVARTSIGDGIRVRTAPRRVKRLTGD